MVRVVNYDLGVLVETDNLIDSAGVADVVGLANSRIVSTYRKRYPDFPAPVIDMGAGRCLLWLRADVEAWAAGRGG
jgi:predicted DNA-binding transcriptional regulator AlpA